MPYKDPAVAKAYSAAWHRQDRADAKRDTPPHRCEHQEGCDHFTAVRQVPDQGWVRNQFCREHAQLRLVPFVDEKTGKTEILPAHDAAQRHRTKYDIRSVTPPKTHRTRRKKGWKVVNHGTRSDAAKLRERLTSPAFRLMEKLGAIWKAAGLTPNLQRVAHPESRPHGRERTERLPADPYELLATVAAVQKAKDQDQGSGFVAIGKKIGKPFGWHCHKDTHGNLTMCPMASKVYRFGQVLDERLPDWRTITKK
jgi:hypothetical protein